MSFKVVEKLDGAVGRLLRGGYPGAQFQVFVPHQPPDHRIEKREENQNDGVGVGIPI